MVMLCCAGFGRNKGIIIIIIIISLTSGHCRLYGVWPLRHQTYGYLPNHSDRCSLVDTELYCLVTEARVCQQLAQGCYLKAEWPGVKSATRKCNPNRTPNLTVTTNCNPNTSLTLTRRWQMSVIVVLREGANRANVRSLGSTVCVVFVSMYGVITAQ